MIHCISLKVYVEKQADHQWIIISLQNVIIYERYSSLCQCQILVKSKQNWTKLKRALSRVHTFTNATFVTISEDRELKSEPFGIVSCVSGENWACYDQNMLLTFSWPWSWLSTYQRIGNWKVNILALVSYESDKNWVCYDQKMFLTFLWPWPLTNQRLGNWKVNILALV